ncbi:hypothetical protein WSM22_37540 [Cytophagales bacterium WSM2-2]|nr:hypothetical protein WSM22_37540 [Cytophagales bacterium WSM2-2]
MTTEYKFKRLVEQYQKGLLSREKQAIMDEFFEDLGKKEEIIPDILWEGQERAGLKERILLKIDRSDEISLMKTKGRTYVLWLRAAAAVFLLTCAYLLVQRWSGFSKRDVLLVKKSSAGEVSKVMLSDGSIVWLKSNSSLQYPREFDGDTRKVTLTGDAVFEVAKNPEVPFVIKFDALTAQVLGTSFGIAKGNDKIELVVLTGKVLVSSTQDDLVVLPHEKAIYDRKQNHLTKESVASADEQTATRGTEYDMHFDDAKMKDIIKRIEGKFNVQVKVSNSSIYNCMLTADFTDQSLDRTLGIIAQTLHCEYRVKNQEVLFLGNGCH